MTTETNTTIVWLKTKKQRTSLDYTANFQINNLVTELVVDKH